MYYKVKNIRLKKNGRISITAAESNVRPITYFTMEYRGDLVDLLYSIVEGNFHLQNTKSNYPYIKVIKTMETYVEMLDHYGLTWDTQWRYDLKDREKALRIACSMYAKRIAANDWTNPESFGRTLGLKLAEVIEEGRKNIEKAKEKDRKEGIIRIDCAAKSIFAGYDLLLPANQNNGYILAPEEDYDNKGTLKTDPKKIVALGRDSEDLYSFLSFTGVDLSMDEYILRYPM